MLFIGLLTAILSTSKLGGVYIITGTCMTQFILCGNYKIYIYGNIAIFICMKYNVPLCIPSRLCFFFLFVLITRFVFVRHVYVPITCIYYQGNEYNPFGFPEHF